MERQRENRNLMNMIGFIVLLLWYQLFFPIVLYKYSRRGKGLYFEILWIFNWSIMPREIPNENTMHILVSFSVIFKILLKIWRSYDANIKYFTQLQLRNICFFNKSKQPSHIWVPTIHLAGYSCAPGQYIWLPWIFYVCNGCCTSFSNKEGISFSTASSLTTANDVSRWPEAKGGGQQELSSLMMIRECGRCAPILVEEKHWSRQSSLTGSTGWRR